MNVPRNSVTTALFNLLSACYAFNRAEPAAEIPSQVPPTDQPAMFLVRPAEDVDDRQAPGALRYELNYGCLVYLQKDAVQSDLGHLPLLDSIADAIDNALQAPFPGQPQTLGGLVAECKISGRMRILSGILGQNCVLVVPILVITGI